MDIGILIDSSFFITADGFEQLKSFVSDLVISINDNFPNVHFGIIVYSNVPKLVMTLQNVDQVDVKSTIEGVKYIPGESGDPEDPRGDPGGDHRTDLAMLYASRKLFCPEGCEDRPEEENVMIVFTAKKTDAESIPYSLVSPIMKVSKPIKPIYTHIWSGSPCCLLVSVVTDTLCYYSTNCNTVQIWSLCTQYLSTELNRYPAIYVISYTRGKMFKSCSS